MRHWLSGAIAVASLGIAGSAALAEQTEAPAANPQVVEKIRAAGAAVSPLAQNDPRLVIGYHLTLGEKATDEQLKPLAELSGDEVYALNLAGTSITNAGLAPLAKLSGLHRLHLEKTEIGDEALKHLAGLQNLEYLNLYATQVSDAGLEHLKGLENLKKLFVWQSQVTAAGSLKLKQALPELAIIPDLSAEPQAAAEKPEDPKP